MADDAVCETELKFEIEAKAVRALRRHPALAAPGETAKLHSTYFDTPRHDLRKQGLTLRVRQSGDSYVQTVKQKRPSAGFGRDEWESGIAGAEPDPDVFRATPVGIALNGQAASLAPVFATDVTRTTRMWTQGGNVVEISLDEGRITADGTHEPIRELELELKAGDPGALFTLARDLAGAGTMRLSFESKGERGYRLVGHDLAALKADNDVVTADMTAAEAFRAVARSCLAQIAGNARLLRRVRSPQALHQTRVGLRRLRAALATFKPLLEGAGEADQDLTRVEAESKWLAGELDAARDLDVFVDTSFRPAEAAAPEDPALAAFGERLLHAQADAYDRAIAALESPRYALLLLETAAWVEVGGWAGRTAAGDQGVAAFAAGSLKRLLKRVKARGHHLAAQAPEERHHLRIQAKKLRYATEMFGEVFGKGAGKRRRRFVVALKALQDRLGELNDIAVARETALRAAGGHSPELAFTAGLLVGRRAHDAPALVAAAAEAFDRLSDAKRFWKG